MTKVVITGAAGSIGRKLRAHFTGLGWELRLLDRAANGDAAVQEADLASYDQAWAKTFEGADAVILLAGDPRPHAPWSSLVPNNFDLPMNVYEAAVAGRAKRVIFASSNWTMGGRRYETGMLTPDVEPHPVNGYGTSKLVAERMGKSFSERHGLSVVCFRIGYCQHELGNRPGAHMNWGRWGQEMWLSDADLCQGFGKAVTAPAALRFAVLNLMSDNPGMRWDLGPTRAAIGYTPVDGAAAVMTPELSKEEEELARHGWGAMESMRDFLMARRG